MPRNLERLAGPIPMGWTNYGEVLLSVPSPNISYKVLSIHVANVTSNPQTFRMYLCNQLSNLGAVGGTELFYNERIPANGYATFSCNIDLDYLTFITGGGLMNPIPSLLNSSLSCTFLGEILLSPSFSNSSYPNLGVADIQHGYYHTVILKANGDVVCCGDNTYKQCNPLSSITPWVDSSTVILSGVSKIAVGAFHTMCVKTNGDVVGWGDNSSSQVNPLSATTPWVTPTTIHASLVSDISSTDSFTMCVKTNGDVVGWGDNSSSQVNPLSATTPWVTPTTIHSTLCSKVSCGGGGHTMVLKTNGDVVGWGKNDRQQTAPSSAVTPWVTPTTIHATGISSIVAGVDHTMALKSNGDVVGWGYNAVNQISPNSTTWPWVNVTTVVATGVSSIYCNNNETTAIKTNGDVVGWGNNNSSRQISLLLPYRLYGSFPNRVFEKDVFKISRNPFSANFHRMLVLKNGDIIGHGVNTYGELKPDQISATWDNPRTIIGSVL